MNQRIPGFTLAVLAATPATAAGQIVTDGSVGAGGMLPVLNGVTVISQDLGQTSANGANLLHSFSNFDVAAETEARFIGDASLLNIIARVTGGGISDIDGLVSVVGPSEANLFLINPAGVAVTDGARFDVPGSLFLSTAHQLHFADGSNVPMAAVTPAGALSVSAPESFGFLGGQGAISIAGVRGDFLPRATELTVVASDISMQNAAFRVGGLSLVATGPGAIGVDLADAASDADPTGDLTLRNTRLFATPFQSDGGHIDIAAGDVTLDTSSAQARTSTRRDAGDVHVRSQSLQIYGGGYLGSQTTDAGNAGEVVIDANEISLTAHGSIRSNTSGAGNAGLVHINADRLLVDGSQTPGVPGVSGIFAQGNSGATGNAGVIRITAQDVTLDNKGRIIVRAFGDGDGGNIVIDTTTLTARAESVVSATSFGDGDAGSVTVRAQTITLDGGALAADSNLGGATGGVGGAIVVEANALHLDHGGQIRTTTFSDRGAGSIRVSVSGEITLSGDSFIASDNEIAEGARSLPRGNAGSVQVEAESLTLRGRSRISSQSNGHGDAGDVTVDVHGALELIATDTAANRPKIGSTSFRSGDAGSVTVTAGSILLDGGALASQAAGTAGLKTAGSVIIRTTGEINASNGAEILTTNRSATTGSNAGSIDIETGGDIILTGASVIQSNAQNGTAGSISINLPETAILFLGGPAEGADGLGQISTSSLLGGGEIQIGSPFAIVLDGAQIDALGVLESADVQITSVLSVRSEDKPNNVRVDGNLIQNTSFVDISTGVEATSLPLFDASRVLRGQCLAARNIGAASTLAAAPIGPFAAPVRETNGPLLAANTHVDDAPCY